MPYSEWVSLAFSKDLAARLKWWDRGCQLSPVGGWCAGGRPDWLAGWLTGETLLNLSDQSSRQYWARRTVLKGRWVINDSEGVASGLMVFDRLLGFCNFFIFLVRVWDCVPWGFESKWRLSTKMRHTPFFWFCFYVSFYNNKVSKLWVSVVFFLNTLFPVVLLMFQAALFGIEKRNSFKKNKESYCMMNNVSYCMYKWVSNINCFGSDRNLSNALNIRSCHIQKASVDSYLLWDGSRFNYNFTSV